MKILIINHHASNHGDEAAGKAFIRALREEEINQEIGILYNTNTKYESEYLNIDHNMKHFKYEDLTLVDKVLIIFTFVFPFFLMKRFFRFGKTITYEYDLIKQYDRIISSPGGVNIGPYKDWRYLWRLYSAVKLGKQVAIYSISFGPLPQNFLFKKISVYVLKKVNFLSLRDKKSQKYANELSINYVSSIDTAFLNNQPKALIPQEIQKQLSQEYVIVVPNQLYKWHIGYMGIESKKLDDIYISIINYFVENNINVVLLPQMYGSENDSYYFESLKNKIQNQEKIIVFPDEYSSDIQQEVIRKANFLVGARYHTIIFSINNKKPFMSLAYEHKMTNTLELLGLLENNVDINNLIDNCEENVVELLHTRYTNRANFADKVSKANVIAHSIAKETFDKFKYEYLKIDKI